jgi:hypothetical protein
VMCGEQGACVRRRSWAGYTIDMFEVEFPTGTGERASDHGRERQNGVAFLQLGQS